MKNFVILLVGVCTTFSGSVAYRAYNDPSEPSPEAQKLIDSLESNIDRWSNWVVTSDETHSHLSGPGGVKIYPGLFLPRVTTAADKRIDFRFNDLCHINRARRTAIAKINERIRANALTALDRKEEGPVEPAVTETAENIAISLRNGDKSWQTVTSDKEVYLMSTSWDITVDSNGDVGTVRGGKNYHTALVLQKMLKSTDRSYLACAYRLRLRDICAAAIVPKDTRVVGEKTTTVDKATPAFPLSAPKLFETFDAPEVVTPAVTPQVPVATPSYSSYYVPVQSVNHVSYSTARQWLETQPSPPARVR